MAERLSTGICNLLLDTAPLKTVFSTPEIRIYSGAIPATADAAEGSIIATVKEGGGALTWAASAAAGVLSKSANAWTDPSAVGGTATHYRLLNHADGGGISTTLPRIQGTVGTGGTDMVVGSTTIGAASVFTVDYYTQALVPS
jgi:hypothetical protein